MSKIENATQSPFNGPIQTLWIATTICLAIVGGISVCLSVWIMPLITLAPVRTTISQFNLTVEKGGRYLQPSSRTLSVCVGALLYLAYTTPGPDSGLRTTLYAVALPVLVQTAPYEIYFIFPVNDRVVELGKVLEGNAGEGERESIEKEVNALTMKWRVRNWGRVMPCLVASLLLMVAGPPV